MEVEDAEFVKETKTSGRLVLRFNLPLMLPERRQDVPKVVKKKKKRKAPKRKHVEKGDGLRAKTEEWLKNNDGKYTVSEIIDGLHSGGYRYPGTGKWRSIGKQMPGKLHNLINKRNPVIARCGKPRHYRYYYIRDESSSSDEEEEVIVPMDIDDIIEKNLGVMLSAEEESSDEEEEKVTGSKRKRYAVKQPRGYATKQPRNTNLVHYNQTDQLANPLHYDGFGGIGPTMIPYQQVEAVVIPDPLPLEDVYGRSSSDEEEEEPPKKRRKLSNKMIAVHASCNHFYERQGRHMCCRWCAHLVRNVY